MEGYTIKGNIEDARIAYDEVLSETKKEIESINDKLKCNEIEEAKLKIVIDSLPAKQMLNEKNEKNKIVKHIVEEEREGIEKRLEELEQNTNSEEFKKYEVRLSILKDRLSYLNSRKREYTEE